jgi:molybdopterin converting factor small subunit
MKTKVTYIQNLFENQRIEFESHNQTVLAIFQSLFQKYPEVRDDPPNITVRVNGKKLHPLKWGKPLNDGDEILIIQEIGIETIVSLLAWGTLGVTFGGVTGAVITGINIGLVIVSIASVIYSYATAPKAPSTGRGLNSSPTYGWDGASMQVRQGVPVPVVYGEHAIGGNVCLTISE